MSKPTERVQNTVRLETHSYEKTFKTYSVETPNHKLVVKNDTSCIGKWDVTQTHME